MYRLSLAIIVATVVASAALVIALERRSASAEPAMIPRGENLGADGYDLGTFKLTERSGRAVTDRDLVDDVWVASFIFTRCPSSCPRISSTMKGLQGKFAGTGVKLVSVSVDPEHDSPEVLARYAKSFEADPVRWWFLTGKLDEVYDLILKRFHLSVGKADEASRASGAEAVAHSDRLVLVDRGNVVSGVFDSSSPDAIGRLVARAKRKGSWARTLPAVNASLNGTCAVLLVCGWVMILTGRTKAHAAFMISSVVVSALFLACYLVYHYEAGSVAFEGVGFPRVAYRTILLSHTLLATLAVVPLVALTLTLAIRKQFDRHAPMARLTFPIWLYVSITGVVIYWMLYHMPVGSS